jgi:hypothetical protein
MMSMAGNTRIMIYQGHYLAMKLYQGMNGDPRMDLGGAAEQVYDL